MFITNVKEGDTMADVKRGNGMEDFLLKECYELAAQYEKVEAVRDILSEKAKGIKVPQNYISVQDYTLHQKTEMQIISEVMDRLAVEAAVGGNHIGMEDLYNKVNSLPGSAEKEFILALLALRNDINEAQRLDALRHTSNALSYLPGDPRYIALATILQEIDK